MRQEHRRTEHSEVREILESSWEQLVAQLEELLDGPHDAAVDAARFGELERQVRGHMRIEDDLMLRPFELHDAHEASALRAEHHELRLGLDQVAEEIGATGSAGQSQQSLMRLLRAHGRRKLMRLFPWVEFGLRRHAKMIIVDRVRALAGGRPSMVEVVSLSQLSDPVAYTWL